MVNDKHNKYVTRARVISIIESGTEYFRNAEGAKKLVDSRYDKGRFWNAILRSRKELRRICLLSTFSETDIERWAPFFKNIVHEKYPVYSCVENYEKLINMFMGVAK